MLSIGNRGSYTCTEYDSIAVCTSSGSRDELHDVSWLHPLSSQLGMSANRTSSSIGIQFRARISRWRAAVAAARSSVTLRLNILARSSKALYARGASLNGTNSGSGCSSGRSAFQHGHGPFSIRFCTCVSHGAGCDSGTSSGSYAIHSFVVFIISRYRASSSSIAPAAGSRSATPKTPLARPAQQKWRQLPPSGAHASGERHRAARTAVANRLFAGATCMVRGRAAKVAA